MKRFFCLLLAGAGLMASQTIDLSKEIDRIPIFDNHSHPGYADDPDVDAMTSPPGTSPFRLRPENPELAAASHALFGYPYTDFSPGHAEWLVKKKNELKQKEGQHYFDSLLDRLNIETVVANRVAMPAYLDPKRFLWVPFVDSFLFPFDNRAIRERNIDEQTYIPLQEKKFKRDMAQAGLSKLPASLDGYLHFVSQMLDQYHKAGAIGIKFEAAYFRSLHFSDPDKVQAEQIYARFSKGGVPPDAEYTLFQDYIFRHLIGEAGRLHLSVHFHTSVGVGDYFDLHNGNVMNLENVLRDPRYEAVNFVLLHGGFPHDREVIWLAERKNVYVDSSLIELMLYPSEVKPILKYWLTIFPEKVLYGSDAFPFNDALGAEECYWMGSRSARKALTEALDELVTEKAITREKALAIARGYLHDNAAKLYGRPLIP